ncbi:hypothetical protein ABG768_015603 [Culter alburnus]|uniref:Uncharacterized protein n=1 Tax=Culter alburnus TaxID=194366 RepID=A0AAW1Z6R0_CULAL
MPLRTREARLHFFGTKQPQSPQAKHMRSDPPSEGSSQTSSQMADLFPFEAAEDDDVDVLNLFPSDEEDDFVEERPAEQDSAVAEMSMAARLKDIIGRAAKALDIPVPVNLSNPLSRFEEEAEAQPGPVKVPLLTDFEEVVRKQFGTPTAPHRWSGTSRKLANVTGADKIGCGSLPSIDQHMAAFISPSNKSVLGKVGGLSKNCRIMDALLSKMHKAMAVQTKLANTGAILSLYLRELSRKAQDEEDLSTGLDEIKQVSSVMAVIMKEQAEAAGKSMSAFWVARHHLWLSQSRLQQEDRDCLSRLPVEPSAMFGPDALCMLQQALRYAKEFSSTLGQRRSFRPKQTQPRDSPDQSQWGPRDLRSQLEASRRGRAQQYKKRDGGRGQWCPPPRS